MLGKLFTKIIGGTKDEREIRRIQPVVDEINAFTEEFDSLSDDALRGKTEEFKQRIREATSTQATEVERLREEFEKAADHEERKALIEEIKNQENDVKDLEQELLDEILPEAFACVKQACIRLLGKSWKAVGRDVTWDMVPYDVQLIGGIILHTGKIAEMKTGEGKTLVATLPMYLNALTGRGVHLVTVNDYLAQRDSEWMGKVLEFLGLTVGCILNDMNPQERRVAYGCDITYGTNNEFGFDYLRDNMAISIDDVVQTKGHYYAIVDEVDSVLVDEARTPLIISGAVDAPSNQKYEQMNPMIKRLVATQVRLVNNLIRDGQRLLETDEYSAGRNLLMAFRGDPKNKRLMKLQKEQGLQQIIQRVEKDYLRDKKMHEIDEELYYSIDEKAHIIDLTEKGRMELSPEDPDLFILPDLAYELSQIEGDEMKSDARKAELKAKLSDLYSERSDKLHSIEKLLSAYALYEKDIEYVVQEGKVLIVDEFTGRVLSGRRYSDGLHQAIEAKEGVKVEKETQTLATITLQNFFRLYDKLAGMTGTAATEALEFFEIYKLDVTSIPTNKPIVRDDMEDRIFKTKREKYNAVTEEIIAMRAAGRPTLVGTTSVEVSETISRMLKRKAVQHEVLNAKQHKREAEIVAHAGRSGSVTIATNMAGRGTDIKLEKSSIEAGGLHIIGTERHESRRIDLQLRGRSGRQGDAGSTVFFISLEDDLMRLFGSERIARVMDRIGVEEGEVISHRWITRAVENAQKKVEFRNFSIRKRLLEYDDVMNMQREVIYNRRAHALSGENVHDEFLDNLEDFVTLTMNRFVPEGSHPEDWDVSGLEEFLIRKAAVSLTVGDILNWDALRESVLDAVITKHLQRTDVWGQENMAKVERFALLKTIDEKWKEHLRSMEDLKEGIHLRGYGQKDPLIEYKREGYEMFAMLLEEITETTIEFAFKYPSPEEVEKQQLSKARSVKAVHQSAMGMGYSGAGEGGSEKVTVKNAPIKVVKRIGRNDPCYCGSGKKFKYCHGA